MRRAALLLALPVLLAAPAPAAAQPDPEKLRVAKELFFDRKYAEARQAWQAILASASGAGADVAAYHVARCSEQLGELERALSEYTAFLERKPADRTLVEEAKTSRVGLAARLYKAGRKQHLGLLQKGLTDPSKTVQYYAAFQLAGLGGEVAQPALPVLKRILAEEKDADLVDRARLYLLRLDPQALGDATSEAAPPAGRPGAREVRWFKLRIYRDRSSEPAVSVNVPMALADLVFDSLPDVARDELRKEGIDAEKFWTRLRKLGPTEIVEIKGEEGELIKIWLE
jgi:tetratricopeptide (TPR) repeat protein